MKVVHGIVREEKVASIVEALERAGVHGLTVTKAAGRGSRTPMGVWRGTTYPALHPMCGLDVIASDEDAEDVAQIMLEHARTGKPGDGHVFVVKLEEVYAVRTRWPRVA